MQARRELSVHVHAHVASRAAVDKSASPNHLLSEQIDKQHRGVALWAVPTQTHGAAEKLAFWTAPLADKTLAATRALIDRVRDDGAPLLELLSEALQVGQAGVVAEAKSALLMRA